MPRCTRRDFSIPNIISGSKKDDDTVLDLAANILEMAALPPIYASSIPS